MRPICEHRAVVSFSDEVREELASIPGVRFYSKAGHVEARCCPDVASVVGVGTVGSAEEMKPLDESLLGQGLTLWQREGAMALASDDCRLLWWSAGLGKSLAYMSAAVLIGAKRVLFVTRSLGRNVFARDSVFLREKKRIAVVVGEGPQVEERPSGAFTFTQSQLYAIKRADRALQRYRDKGADCFACGAVAHGWEDVGEGGDQFGLGRAWGIVVTWETLALHEAAILRAGFDLAVFDEHHCGKHYRSKRTASAHRIAQAVPVVWGGTATPVPDRVRDLWGQLYAVCGRKVWGTSLQFARRYCHATPGPFGGWETDGPHRIGCSYCARTTVELKSRLDFWTDVKTHKLIEHRLPPVTRSMIHVPPGREDEEAETRTQARGIEAAVSRAAAQKVKPVAEAAAEALVGRQKIAVVGNRRSWVPRMERAVRAALPPSMLRGGRVWLRAVSGEQDVSVRQEVAAEFLALQTGREEPFSAACLIATVDSIRTSIDLHDADRVLIAALPWTPEALEQLLGRFRRMGQRRNLQIDFFIAEGTIDESIEDVLLSKMAVLSEAGAEVDAENRTWLDGQQPLEEEVLRLLHEKLREKADVIERSSMEAS